MRDNETKRGKTTRGETMRRRGRDEEDNEEIKEERKTDRKKERQEDGKKERQKERKIKKEHTCEKRTYMIICSNFW